MTNQPRAVRGNLLPFVFFFIASSLILSHAQSPRALTLAEKEAQRRQFIAETFVPQMLEKGRTALQERDYENAFRYFQSAVDAMPLGGAPEVVRERNLALREFAQAAEKFAKLRISEGRFADAEQIVQTFLTQYDPKNPSLLALERQLKTPGYYNKTLTPGFIAKVEEVKQLLQEAEGFYQSGRYDLAMRRYEQVLNIDRFNIAARRGMEKVNKARQKYAEAAYNHTRAAMVAQVERGWEIPAKKVDQGVTAIVEQPQIDIAGAQVIENKLNNIIIPRIEFNDTTIREAIAFLRRRSVELDTTETDPTKKGVNIVLLLNPQELEAQSQSRITLSLTDTPLGVVLDFVAQAVGLKTKIEPYAVAIVPLSASTEQMITKEYNVPPSLITGDAPSDQGISSRARAKQALEAKGVEFPEGAFAQYFPSSSKLVVRNTIQNLNFLDGIVETALSTPPTQIEIQSKFLEITQDNMKELGLDWLLGQFSLPFGSGVYGSGGTGGSESLYIINDQPVPLNRFYPILGPTGGVPVGLSNPSPQINPTTGTGQITAGNRSGGTAFRVNALDALLFGSPAGPAPGVLALAGVFTNPQFQVVLRAIEQMRGIDLMSAPTVTTGSGQQATVEITREFYYPSEYNPPQPPQTVAIGVYNPVAPATPSAFDFEKIGVVLEVDPTILDDGFSIDMRITPRVTEFDGFINYGSPIFTSAPVLTATGIAPFQSFFNQRIQITPNNIYRPVFSYRDVTTRVTIQDGMTIALGGLIREDVQTINDKTPILGDIPVLGRAFRTVGSKHIKRNLIIFVTANLIDPAGQRITQPMDVDTLTTEAPAPQEILPPLDATPPLPLP